MNRRDNNRSVARFDSPPRSRHAAAIAAREDSAAGCAARFVSRRERARTSSSHVRRSALARPYRHAILLRRPGKLPR